MIKQIRSLKGLKNKTIVDSKIDGFGDLYLKFSDNSVACFKTEDITEGYGYVKYKINIDDFDIEPTNKTLLNLNIITKEEYNDALEKEEKEHQLWLEEQKKQEDEELKKWEMKQFNALKEKYNL